LIEKIGIESEHGSKGFDEVRGRISSLATLAKGYERVRSHNRLTQLLLSQVAKFAGKLQAWTDEHVLI
jgi:hypothetical protein